MHARLTEMSAAGERAIRSISTPSGVCCLLAAEIFGLALAEILHRPTTMNVDVSMYLQAGDLLWHGALPYVDVVDLNPPLIFYLNVIPAAIARAIGTPLIVTWLVIIWMLTVASAAAARYWARRAFGRDTPHGDLIALAIAAGSAWVLFRDDYGQREHLFVLALAPYVMMRAAREHSPEAVHTWRVTLTAVLAAIAASFKPHLVAIVLAIELYFFVARRPRRLMPRGEVVTFLAVVALYGAHFLFLPGAMRHAFFDRYLPLTVAGYASFDASYASMLSANWSLGFPVMCLLVMLLDRRIYRAFVLRRALTIATAVAIVMFFVQHKGWPYQLIPATAASALISALALGDLLERRTSWGARRTLVPQAAAFVSIVAVLAVAAWMVRPRTVARLQSYAAVGQPWARVLNTYSRPGDHVLIIDTHSNTSYPLLVQYDRLPASRYLWWFPVSMLYSKTVSQPGRPFPYELVDPWRRKEEAQFRADVARDIAVHAPSLIIIDTPEARCYACPEGFTMGGYLTATGFMSSAMSGYAEVTAERQPEFAVYLPLRRRVPRES